jgi:hypothetical protein
MSLLSIAEILNERVKNEKGKNRDEKSMEDFPSDLGPSQFAI